MRICNPILFFLACILLSGCAQHPAKNEAITASASQEDFLPQDNTAQNDTVVKKMTAAQITSFVIHAADNKFGYTIFVDGQLYIEQKNIPAIDGNAGFTSKEDAEKIAELVISKMRNGEIPPTVTIAELKAEGIID